MTEADIRRIVLEELEVVLGNAESELSRGGLRNNDLLKLCKAIVLKIQDIVRRRQFNLTKQ